MVVRAGAVCLSVLVFGSGCGNSDSSADSESSCSTRLPRVSELTASDADCREAEAVATSVLRTRVSDSGGYGQFDVDGAVWSCQEDTSSDDEPGSDPAVSCQSVDGAKVEFLAG